MNYKYQPLLISKYIDKKTLQQLVEKNNILASLYLLFHLGIIILFALLFILFLKKEFYFICFLIYITYCSIFNFLGTAGAMHEFAHGTVFSNKKVNKIFYFIFGCLTWTNPSMFLATHFKHHKDMLFDDDFENIIGREKRLSKLEMISMIFISPFNTIKRIYYVCLSALGIFKSPVLRKILINKSRQVQFDAIIILLFHIMIIAISIIIGSFVPILLFSLPAFVARYPAHILAVSQHNVDISNKKTYNQLSAAVSIRLPFFLRAIYWNMNFHCEHHFLPTVPHYNLKKLQSILLKDNSVSKEINTTDFISELRNSYVKN